MTATDFQTGGVNGSTVQSRFTTSTISWQARIPGWDPNHTFETFGYPLFQTRYSRQLVELVHRCLAWDPDDRPATREICQNSRDILNEFERGTRGNRPDLGPVRLEPIRSPQPTPFATLRLRGFRRFNPPERVRAANIANITAMPPVPQPYPPPIVPGPAENNPLVWGGNGRLDPVNWPANWGPMAPAPAAPAAGAGGGGAAAPARPRRARKGPERDRKMLPDWFDIERLLSP